MSALAAEIRERIRREGPLSVATYMELCLSHPTHGYYRRGGPIGAAGDFITAPEVSQMFGELVGLWCAAVWQTMRRPQRVRLVELGPGRGTLLADALRAANAVAAFRDAIDLHLVESSETLRAEQAALLGDARPTWHERFETVPPGPVLVIANEFFDALPIRQFERVDNTWRERMVTLAPASHDALRLRRQLHGMSPRQPVPRHRASGLHRRAGSGAGSIGRNPRPANCGRRRRGAHH